MARRNWFQLLKCEGFHLFFDVYGSGQFEKGNKQF